MSSPLEPTLGLLLLQAGGMTSNPLIPVILMVVVFYLVLFLPMRNRQRKHDEMLKNLKSGDKVVTNGGLIGVITGLSDKSVTLRVRPDNIKLEFARSSVNGLAEQEEAKD
ncbi:MAG: preprotein translocase subunit YajC [Acidobacteria bacterium]|nr:preprotein translocase subunit YajC [Acidobacteriota bacterium]